MAGRITAIEVQKNNPRRANVFIEGEFAFGLAIIEAAKLSKGQVLGEDDIAALRERDEQERAYESALTFLSYRPRSQEEVTRRLREKGFSEATVEIVIGRLCQAGLLDDEAFARFWVDNREQFKPRGRFALRQELGQKGIDSRIVDALVAEMDETESAYRAALQRFARWERLDPATRRRRLSDYLRRRGFGYETIQQTWDRLNAEQEQDSIEMENGEDIAPWDKDI